jgi:acyl-CoA synthetase (AMP-forming)/AMP-acid ligase II
LAEAAAPGFPGWPAGTALVVTGGALSGPLRQEVCARVTRNLMVLYGATETGPISLATPEEVLAHPDTVGRPYPQVAVRIVDDAGRPVPRGARGLIRIRTPAGVTRYLDDEEATGRAFHDGWFEPGDVCEAVADGSLIYAGRADDMMNLGSIKIFPAEIEAAAEGFPGLVECAAFALRAPALGDIPVLAAVAREDFDAAALLAHCRARLGVRAPRKVVVLPALPRNAVGKVVRRDLPRLADGGLPPEGG